MARTKQARCPFCGGIAVGYLQWTMDKSEHMRQTGWSRIIVDPCLPCNNALSKWGDILSGERGVYSWEDVYSVDGYEEDDDDED